MQTFRAGRTGNAIFSGEVERRERMWPASARRACRGTPVRMPAAVMSAKLAGLLEPRRIKVRFGGAKEAVGRLFALAQVLMNDLESFENLGPTIAELL
jgi:hypothetical protein